MFCIFFTLLTAHFAAVRSASDVEGDVSTHILINFGRKSFPLIQPTSQRKNGFSGNDVANTLASSSNYLLDYGLVYGKNAGPENPSYGWSGTADLNENEQFDPQGHRYNVQWYVGESVFFSFIFPIWF